MSLFIFYSKSVSCRITNKAVMSKHHSLKIIENYFVILLILLFYFICVSVDFSAFSTKGARRLCVTLLVKYVDSSCLRGINAGLYKPLGDTTSAAYILMRRKACVELIISWPAVWSFCW